MRWKKTKLTDKNGRDKNACEMKNRVKNCLIDPTPDLETWFPRPQTTTMTTPPVHCYMTCFEGFFLPKN